MQANRPRTATLVQLLSLLLLVFLWLASCTGTTPELPTPPAPSPPAVVEVTRIVERIVTPTPEPTAAPAPATPVCNRGELANVPEVVIGALAPLSRPGALMTGFAMQTAFTLAVEDLNAAGGVAGRPVRLVTYDTANSAQLGAHYAERLITLDCVVAIVGVHHTAVGEAVKATAHQLGAPVVFSSVFADELTADHHLEIFRINPTLSMIAQMPSQWLAEVGDYNQDGSQVAVIITAQGEENTNLASKTSEWLVQAGFAVETQSIDLPAIDFSSDIARIVALDHTPDAIFLSLMGETALAVQTQLLAAGVGPKQGVLLISNSSALDDQLFWQRTPDGVFTVVPRLGAWPSAVTPLGAEFAQKFATYFDRWPDLHAFAAYDAVRLVGDAVARAGSTAPAAVIAALETSDIELASGRYHFPYGVSRPPNGAEAPAHWWHQWLDAPLLYLQYTEVGQSARYAAVIWPARYRTIAEPVLRLNQDPP